MRLRVIEEVSGLRHRMINSLRQCMRIFRHKAMSRKDTLSRFRVCNV